MRTAMTLAEWKNKRGRPFFFSIQTGQQKLRAKRGHHHQVKWKYKYRHGMAHHGRESSISPAVLHFFIFSWLVGVGKNSPLFALVKFEIRPGDFICSSVSWLFTFFFKCNMREREYHVHSCGWSASCLDEKTQATKMCKRLEMSWKATKEAARRLVTGVFSSFFLFFLLKWNSTQCTYTRKWFNSITKHTQTTCLFFFFFRRWGRRLEFHFLGCDQRRARPDYIHRDDGGENTK